MEILIIHRMRGIVPPELMMATMELAKKIEANPGQVVPGGKEVFAYSARSQSMVVALWDVPNLEALMPVEEQMTMLGWDTDVIPVEKMSVALPKIEKAFQAMQAKR